ncbi:MAG: hypothetical protein GEV05_19610 [Betaproteobacteria bacterium]|nr:hypothetical protein [Betaproteobacteria bacterium]
MLVRSLVLAAATAVSTLGHGEITNLDLSGYRLERTFALPAPASAASALAYNWDRGTLLVLGDAADALIEITRTGAVVSTMTLIGFGDGEGLTYIGDGCFVLTEQRLRSACLLRYMAGASATRTRVPSISLGASDSIERVPRQPPNDASIATGTSSPQAIDLAGADFGAVTAAVASLFAPTHGVPRAADVRVRSGVPSPRITHADDFRIHGSASMRPGGARHGAVLSVFDFSVDEDPADGIRVGGSSAICLVDDGSSGHGGIAPASRPASVVLLDADLGLLVCRPQALVREAVMA